MLSKKTIGNYWSSFSGYINSLTKSKFTLHSDEIKDNGFIDLEHSQYGSNKKPKFTWYNIPENTVFFCF